MADGLLPSIRDFVRSINDRKREHRVDEQLGNYLTDPQGSIAGVMKFDPRLGIKLDQDRVATEQAATEKARTRGKEDFGTVTQYLRGLDRSTTDFGAEVDGMADFLTGSLGMRPESVAAMRSAIVNNPGIIDALDEDVNKERAKASFGSNVLTPGSELYIGGKPIRRVPFAIQGKTLRRGDGGVDLVPFDPNPVGGGGFEEGPEAVRQPAEPGGAAPSAGQVDDAEDMLRGAMESKVLGQSVARKIQQALGPEQANAWMKKNGIRVVPDAQAPAPAAPRDLPVQRVQPAPATRAAPKGPTYSTPGKAPKRLRPATAEELRGYPPGTAAQIDEETGELKNLKTPPASAQPKPLTQKEKLAQEASVERARGVISSMGRLRSAAARLKKHPGFDNATGSVQGRLPDIVLGQQGTNFRNELDNLKRVVSLEAMQAMKALSATGATGFGNMSNEEGKRIEAMLGTLETTNDRRTLERTLDAIIQFTEEKIASANRGLRGSQRAPAAQPRQGGAPRLGTVAVNPQTGQRIILDNSGWVDMATGKPVKMGRKK